jgi:hypothetical protein
MKNLFLKIKLFIKKILLKKLLNLLKSEESIALIDSLLKKQSDSSSIALNAYSVLMSRFHTSILNDRIAVFGVLPPQKSGIAYFNAGTFGLNDTFHLFSAMKTQEDHVAARNIVGPEYKNNFFTLETYNVLKTKINYKTKIFVLGNSEHNIPYLMQAVNEPDKHNSWLYLHDVITRDVIYLLFQYKTEVCKEIFCKVYPEFAVKIIKLDTLNNLIDFLEENNLYGIKIIIYLTEITNVIINTHLAQKLVEHEINEDIFIKNIKIVKLFLPLPNLNYICSKNIYPDKNTFLIGSFGIPNDKHKSTKIVIEAVNILNKQYNIKSKCILAGYHINQYYKCLPQDLRNFVIPFYDVSDDELFSLMKSVHLAVQLRNFTSGESSGIISQLMGMNKKIIVTESFVDTELEKCCITVPKFVSKETLSDIIMKELQTNNEINNNTLLDQFSFQNLSNKILKL